MTDQALQDIYGYRARIGYLSPPAATEVFPYEFYKVVPAGVTLVISTLAIVSMSQDEIGRSWEMSVRAGKALVEAEVDLVIFGGRPINRSQGRSDAQMVDELRQELGANVITSTTAQMEALHAVGARKVVMGHPFPESQSAMMSTGSERFGFDLAGVRGLGYPTHTLGKVPRGAAMQLAADLMREHPDADTLWLPCPHWAVAESIAPIEREFGISVVTALQAITWAGLRRCGVHDRIDGFGRLLSEF